MMTLLLADHLPALAVAAAVLALLATLLQSVRLRHVAQKLEAEQVRVHALAADLNALLSCSRTIGERVLDSQQTERRLQKQLDQLALKRDDGQIAVEHAMKLLNNGQSLDEVIDICELSEGEAEILQNLSRFRAAA